MRHIALKILNEVFMSHVVTENIKEHVYIRFDKWGSVAHVPNLHLNWIEIAHTIVLSQFEQHIYKCLRNHVDPQRPSL